MNEETIQPNQEDSSGDIQSELEICQKQRDEYLDGWKRAKADFINYKKEESARMENLVKFGSESILYDIISVLDSLDMGITAIEDDTEAQKGIKLIRMQLEDVVKRHGLEPINAPPGTPFNPAYHEAVEEIASDMPEGVIVEEVKRGYVLHGKVLRPTKTKIAKKS